MSEEATLAFEIRYPDGQWVRIFLDGRVEGVPDGTVTVNWFGQHLNLARAQLHLSQQVRP